MTNILFEGMSNKQLVDISVTVQCWSQNYVYQYLNSLRGHGASHYSCFMAEFSSNFLCSFLKIRNLILLS